MTAKDTLNIIYARAAGLDVHKMEITASVRLARPRAAPETATKTFSALPSGLRELVGWLLQYRIEAAVLEGTGIFWEAPFEALEDAGIRPLLMNAQHVKQIKGRKTDIKDSVWLATICQFGLGSPSMIPPARFRSLRKVSRLRRQLIGDQARLRNRVHKIIDAAGVRIGGVLSDAFGVNGLRILEGLVAGHSTQAIVGSLSPHVRRRVEDLRDALTAQLGEYHRFLLTDCLRAWKQAMARRADYDEVLDRGLSGFGDLIELLMTIPGIDRKSAAAILVELGPDIRVFPTRRQCAAWAGLCPGNNASAGKRRASRIRQGNAALRAVLIECAHGAARTHDCQFQRTYRALTVRRGVKRAIVATAHKMLHVIYAVLDRRTPYRDPQTDYEAIMVRRNAPRWITMLQKHGIDPLTGEPSVQPAV